MATYTAAEILQKLDDDASRLDFPMLDNGYIYPADVRMMVYRDEQRWAILIEELGYHYKSGFPDGVYTSIYTAGSGATAERVYQTCASVFEADDEPDARYQGDVPPDLKQVFIRGVSVEVPRKKSLYRAKGIKLLSSVTRTNELWGQELLRVLLPEHREALLAMKEELASFLKPNMPFFLRLDAWHHPDLCNDQLPSHTGTFPSLCEAIASGDPNRFLMTKKPNTNWKNWPGGGSL